jgi:uncharacterized protein (TIGR02145 family)
MKRTLLAAIMMLVVIGCKDMKLDIEQSKDRIEELESAVTSIAGQIAGINSVIAELKQVDEELQRLIDKLTASNEDYAKLIAALKTTDGEINDRIDALHIYISEQLNNSTDIHMSIFATLEQYAELQKEIADIRTLVESVKQEITEEYTSAIEVSISALEDAVNAQIKALSDRVGKLEEDFVNRIQSMKYIPEYGDGKVVISYITTPLSLDFLISPSAQAIEVQKAWEEDGKNVTAYLRPVKSPDTRAAGAATPLSVRSVTGSEDGVLNVVINPLDDKLISEDGYAVVYINISDGNNDVFSDIVDIHFHPFIRYESLSLSASGERQTANSYIVSEAGAYKFNTVKGNSDESVGEIAYAEVLWESFGTSVTPTVGDLIADVKYSDGYIAFQTNKTFKEGNAVITGKDVSGTIIWSWHIWLTDEPRGQIYFNNAGTVMDRNLGATSPTPGDVAALGLYYQWGRKDPFLGLSAISKNSSGENPEVAKSTIIWPSPISADPLCGTISFATANPTTFIDDQSDKRDWLHSSEAPERWTTSENSKSIYDPCPAGWRVPDGAHYGVWANALGTYETQYYTFDKINNGMNFSGKLGSDDIIWYPAAGYRSDDGLGKYVGIGTNAWYWSAYNLKNWAQTFWMSSDGRISNVTHMEYKCAGCSVRCVKE